MTLIEAEAVKAAPWIYKFLREFGIFAVMTVFFTWQSYDREGRQTKRQDATDEYIRTTLVQTVENNTKTNATVAAALEGFRGDLAKLGNRN